ncbi:MAG: STAS domain-containing protein [Streptomyces sp.]
MDGEVDFTTSPRLADALDEAVTSAAGRAELDLDGVSFCDFSCWDVLLAARERAREVGVEFTCVALSPVAERVLELTQVAPVLRAA